MIVVNNNGCCSLLESLQSVISREIPYGDTGSVRSRCGRHGFIGARKYSIVAGRRGIQYNLKLTLLTRGSAVRR